ncbi:MAG: aminopeptidase P family N-terminal domain-containing protein, partial [Planctomycetaceae bacterium]
MTTGNPELNLDYSRERQRRLQEFLAEQQADAAVFVAPEHVQYLSGFRPHRLMEAMVALTADGRCTLVAPNTVPERAAADDVAAYPAQWHSTLR